MDRETVSSAPQPHAVRNVIRDNKIYEIPNIVHTSLEEGMVYQILNSHEKRLARALLMLADFGQRGRPKSTIPKISFDTLAQMIGTTISRVNFFMRKFRKLGFIDWNGELKINNSLLNVVLRDQFVNLATDPLPVGLPPQRTPARRGKL